MATIHDFRPVQTAARRYGRQTQVYRAVVRRIRAEQQQGFSGLIALHEALMAHGFGRKPDGGAA